MQTQAADTVHSKSWRLMTNQNVAKQLLTHHSCIRSSPFDQFNAGNASGSELSRGDGSTQKVDLPSTPSGTATLSTSPSRKPEYMSNIEAMWKRWFMYSGFGVQHEVAALLPVALQMEVPFQATKIKSHYQKCEKPGTIYSKVRTH